MADASCGGSTPLKALADRGFADKSHQQDRHLHSVSGPSTFRTPATTVSAGANHEYQGFVNGPQQTSLTSSPAERLQAISFHQHHDYNNSGSGASLVSTPGHIQDRNSTGRVIRQPGSWASDFTAFAHGRQGSVRTEGNSARQSPATPDRLAAQHVPQQIPYANLGGSFGGSFVGPMHPTAQIIPGPVHGQTGGVTTQNAPADFDSAMAQWMAVNSNPQVDAGVDAALDELARELDSSQDTASMAKAAAVTDTMSTNDEQRSDMYDDPPDVSSLSISGGGSTNEAHDTDEVLKSDVSEAARQLLETVQHEQGDKWKQSRFLMLMRDFRDGTKDIVGDKIHDTSRG